MEIKPIQIKKPKAKIALQGTSGSGKSYSALILAYGLCGAYEKIVVLETDYKSAHHYSYFGAFNTLTINAPYIPEKFIDAIELCERSGIEVIIIDTLSAEWIGIGGMVERIMEEGDETILWHKSLMSSIINSQCHIIATLQTTEHYQIMEGNNSPEIVKIGLSPFQKEDIHYQFHTVLLLDSKHRIKPLKDRTSFFEAYEGAIIKEEISALFARWCIEGESNNVPPDLLQRINSCKSNRELLELLFKTEVDDTATMQAFTKRRLELQELLEEININSIKNTFSNGDYNHRA